MNRAKLLAVPTGTVDQELLKRTVKRPKATWNGIRAANVVIWLSSEARELERAGA